MMMAEEKPVVEKKEDKKRKQKSKENQDEEAPKKKKEMEPKQKEGAAKAKAKGEKKGGAGGGAQFELGGRRMVTISAFGGKPRVDLREYYLSDREDENSLAPGKKGLSLTVEQWKKLRQLGDQIDAVLEGM